MENTSHSAQTTARATASPASACSLLARLDTQRTALLTEHPLSTVTIGINERALDAATVTKMHAAGFTDYDLLDAEQIRQALEDAEDQP